MDQSTGTAGTTIYAFIHYLQLLGNMLNIPLIIYLYPGVGDAIDNESSSDRKVERTGGAVQEYLLMKVA